eukprot:bmy_22381T0
MQSNSSLKLHYDRQDHQFISTIKTCIWLQWRKHRYIHPVLPREYVNIIIINMFTTILPLGAFYNHYMPELYIASVIIKHSSSQSAF